MHVTRAILFVYRELDVKLRVGRWRRRRFHHTASDVEIADALHSFRGFPSLVADLSDGAASVEYEIVHADRPLTSLTQETLARFWPSAADTRPELDRFVPLGEYDSVFVFWPQHDSSTASKVPCDAWGLALPATAASNGATYAAIANAPTAAWQGEARGEVWLHEWLHGVCGGYAQQGHAMPARDADGAELHGYARSVHAGWTDYYRDLMTAKVLENGARVGIPMTAWRMSYASGNPARSRAA
jgi:hypothetical protein